MRIGIIGGGVIARLILDEVRQGSLRDIEFVALRFNTHYINIRGRTGLISIRFESVPSPGNPKTAMLACYSALAALRALASPARYGT